MDSERPQFVSLLVFCMNFVAFFLGFHGLEMVFHGLFTMFEFFTNLQKG